MTMLQRAYDTHKRHKRVTTKTTQSAAGDQGEGHTPRRQTAPQQTAPHRDLTATASTRAKSSWQAVEGIAVVVLRKGAVGNQPVEGGGVYAVVARPVAAAPLCGCPWR